MHLPLLAGLTRSNKPESNGWAQAAVLLGLFAVAALPAALALAEMSEPVELLHAAAAIPVAAVLGGAALVLGTRARREVQLTLGRVGGDRLARFGRALGALGLYLAVTAALAIAFFALLTLFE